MRQVDQSFGRLASAWLCGSLDATDGAGFSGAARPRMPQAVEGSANHCLSVSPERPAPKLHADSRVVVTRGLQLPPPLFECGVLASQHVALRGYEIEPVLVASLGELEHRCVANPPRVLIVDIGLITTGGVSALQHVRRRLPATDWLVASDTPLSGDVDLSLLREVRGCINWSFSSEHVVHGLDAVVAGKLWFPGSILESLCLLLLDGHEPGPRAAVVDKHAKALTARESEVFGLMRHGLTNRQIGERIGVSANTVKKHLAHVFEKRGLHGRRQELE